MTRRPKSTRRSTDRGRAELTPTVGNVQLEGDDIRPGRSMGVQTASNRPETAGPPAGAIPNNPGVTLDMELPKKSKRKHKS